MLKIVALICHIAGPCDAAHAVDAIPLPCASSVPIACLIEAQQRLAQTTMGRDMRGLTVRVDVERVKRRLEVAR